MKKVLLLLLLVMSLPVMAQTNIYSGFNKVDTTLNKDKLSGDSLCGLLPVVKGKVYYSEIVPVKDVSADKLYIRARSWVAKTFVNSQKVIQMENKEAHKLILKGSGVISNRGHYFFCTITIQAKDGRYRYEISDFIFQGLSDGFIPKIIKQPFETYFKGCDCENKKNRLILITIKRNTEITIIQSLNKTMITVDPSEKEDNW
ncbi:DUF4468 domain-containing protein [uncultured Bacteroides sp.]|uniref:DUF4468 domain-containing protein n=1 Tax=uncultured Bacteroides sp. TaxID=162156 RepID=UPI002AAB641B|nr:DUF4468 domain-containing protein [uncultured Bacteroides sp.]